MLTDSSLLVLLLGYVVAFNMTLYFPLVAPVDAVHTCNTGSGLKICKPSTLMPLCYWRLELVVIFIHVWSIKHQKTVKRTSSCRLVFCQSTELFQAQLHCKAPNPRLSFQKPTPKFSQSRYNMLPVPVSQNQVGVFDLKVAISFTVGVVQTRMLLTGHIIVPTHTTNRNSIVCGNKFEYLNDLRFRHPLDLANSECCLMLASAEL